MSLPRQRMNENGLTLARWLYAAGERLECQPEHVAAWKRGECPCDWRAAKQKKGKA